VLAGAICCGLTGALISPISWTHHWVWCVPLLIMLAVAAFRLRSAGPALAAVAAGAVFSGTISLPWPGWHPVLPQQWQDDLYVLAGLAVLAATAAGLAWKRSGRARNPGRLSEP
jgi:alpha-1,2-mannosyltransferase